MRLALLLAIATSLTAANWKLLSVTKIWDQPQHAAFGDLIRWNNQWFAVFREGLTHAPSPGKPDDGKLRVLSSRNGDSWTSLALLAEPGVDLRDPHLSITPQNQLMIVAGGSYYPNGEFKTRQSRVFFSKNGTNWTNPQPVVEDGHWLWRVTWHNGAAYGVSKYGDPRKVRLVKSKDGKQWESITQLEVPGGDETALRFLPGGQMVALTRRTAPDGNLAWVGSSKPPYTHWTWHTTGHFIGGPNIAILPNGLWAAGGRLFENGDPAKRHTVLGELTPQAFTPKLTLPSAGDSSYPGFVFHDNTLWTLYYSSHENNKTSIFLAKIKIE